jgi:hypothetical protein
MTPDTAQQFIRAQMSLWARVIKDRNITLE